TLRIAFAGANLHHARRGIQQRQRNVRCGLSGGAIDDRAVNGAGISRRASEKSGENGEENSRTALTHRAPRSVTVALTPRGRRTWNSVACSISVSTTAASFSSAVFIVSKSPSEYFPARYSNFRSRRLS